MFQPKDSSALSKLILKYYHNKRNAKIFLKAYFSLFRFDYKTNCNKYYNTIKIYLSIFWQSFIQRSNISFHFLDIIPLLIRECNKFLDYIDNSFHPFNFKLEIISFIFLSSRYMGISCSKSLSKL